MQTFLPYPNFVDTAKCLDRKRLGKQRVETLQILQVLYGVGRKLKSGKMAWENHPAVRMWRGYERALFQYGTIICAEWSNRNYKDSCFEKMLELTLTNNKSFGRIVYPEWLGVEQFHASHRSNLLRKDGEFYGKYNWKEAADLPYWWPE